MNKEFFYSLNEYYRKKYMQKAYKISLNGGMGCPNRDGTVGVGGCIFCSNEGSGDFAGDCKLEITEQITKAITFISNKYKGNIYIGYFQAFTNTYASVEYLEDLFMKAISDDRITELSIATRPDCLPDEVIALLIKLNRIKPVTIELGLQTSNEETARYINRGYPLKVYDNACQKLLNAGIPFVTHMIVGLPNETTADFLNTAHHICKSGATGIKIQLLHILENTKLAEDYRNGLFETMSLSDYAKAVVDIIEILPENMVIHRITGDGPKKLLIAPMWSTNKKIVLNTITKEFINRNTYQGKESQKWL